MPNPIADPENVTIHFDLEEFKQATPMGTTVVNVRNEPCDIYIGRGNWRGHSGRWGNPFTHVPSKYATTVCKDRNEAVARYANWLHEEIKNDRITPHDLAPLAGKKLGCWCAPELCHGHLLAVAAEAAAEHLLDLERLKDRLRGRVREVREILEELALQPNHKETKK